MMFFLSKRTLKGTVTLCILPGIPIKTLRLNQRCGRYSYPGYPGYPAILLHQDAGLL